MEYSFGEAEMKIEHNSTPAPFERVENISEIRNALGIAIREALMKHKQAGNSVAVWRNGQVVWIKS
jgi:hypothetical protein